MPSDFFNLIYISWFDLFIRVGLAIVFGFILGLDRGSKNKPIDFRAYMIVCVTACIIAILGQELYAEFSTKEIPMTLDLAKIIAGVLTGIGFLGAGAIIKVDNDQVVGTATGASIWAAGGIGLTLGFGYYGIASVAFLAIAIILIIGGVFKPKISGELDKRNKKT